VKPAFADLEDIGFEFKDSKKKGGDSDNGLIAGDDFGDEFEDDYEDDFEDLQRKDRIVEPASNKKESEEKDKPTDKKITDEDEDDENLSPEERIKVMLTQFEYIYQNDPALRKLLGEEIGKFTVEEKLEILRAYMEGGGV